ncbi:unnamed protein product, partial [Mesorhabditis belari]|uniref:Uncharacterized protein n=1 Tax=Mesorhabditis belari TaxID=2138241 RepID=A0AAF3FL87_9BILA
MAMLIELEDLRPTVNQIRIFSCIALAINLMVLLLIVFGTPKAMIQYGRLLLLYQIVSTLVDWGFGSVLFPIFCFPVVGGVPFGWLANFDVPTDLMVIIGCTMVFALAGANGALFFQRQQAILPESHLLKMTKHAPMYIFLYTTGLQGFTFSATILHFNDSEAIRYAKLQDYPELLLFFQHPKYYGFQVEAGIYIISMCAVYVAIMIFYTIETTVPTYYYMNKVTHLLSSSTQKMQRQLLTCLCIQSGFSMGFIISPVLIAVICVLGNLRGFESYNLILPCLITLHGVSSSLCIPILYLPYRRFLFQKLNLILPAKLSIESAKVATPLASLQISSGIISSTNRMGIVYQA